MKKRQLHSSLFLVLLMSIPLEFFGQDSINTISDTSNSFQSLSHTKSVKEFLATEPALESTIFGYQVDKDDRYINEAKKYTFPIDKSRGINGKPLSGKESDLRIFVKENLPNQIYVRSKSYKNGKKCEYLVLLPKEYKDCYTVNRAISPSNIARQLKESLPPEKFPRTEDIFSDLIDYANKQKEALSLRKKAPNDFLFRKATIKALSFETSRDDLKTNVDKWVTDAEDRNEIFCICLLNLVNQDNLMTIITKEGCKMRPMAKLAKKYIEPEKLINIADSLSGNKRKVFLKEIENSVAEIVGESMHFSTFSNYYDLNSPYIETAFTNQIKSDVKSNQHWDVMRENPQLVEDYYPAFIKTVKNSLKKEKDLIEFIGIFHWSDKQVNWAFDWAFNNLEVESLKKVLMHKKVEGFSPAAMDKLLVHAKRKKGHGYLYLELAKQEHKDNEKVKSVVSSLINLETDSLALENLILNSVKSFGEEMVEHLKNRLNFDLAIKIVLRNENLKSTLEPEIRKFVNNPEKFEKYVGVYPENTSIVFPYISKELTASELQDLYSTYSESLKHNIGEIYASKVRKSEDAKWFIKNYSINHPNSKEIHEKYFESIKKDSIVDSTFLITFVNYMHNFGFDKSMVKMYVESSQKSEFLNLIKSEKEWLTPLVGFFLVGESPKNIYTSRNYFEGIKEYERIRLQALNEEIDRINRKTDTLGKWIIPKLESGEEFLGEPLDLNYLENPILVFQSNDFTEGLEIEVFIEGEKSIYSFSDKEKIIFLKLKEGERLVNIRVKNNSLNNNIISDLLLDSSIDQLTISIQDVPTIIKKHLQTIIQNPVKRNEFNSIILGLDKAEDKKDFEAILGPEFLLVNDNLNTKYKASAKKVAELYLNIAKPYLPIDFTSMAWDTFNRVFNQSAIEMGRDK